MSNTTPLITPPAPPETPPPAPIIAKSGKRFRFFNASGFYGYVPVVEPDVPEMDPFMSWRGARISMDVWQQVLAFFEWSPKDEVQVRLFYNPDTARWAAWAFPQKPNGMTTSEDDSHPDYAVQRAQFRNPWILLGTIHHHCSANAFQSSVDTQNERNQDGVHITVGKIGSGEYDIHGRIILRSTQYEILWNQWFPVPAEARRWPWKLQKTVLDYFLKSPPPPGTPFPEQWKTNCVKPVAAPASTRSWQGGGSSGGSSGDETVVTDLAGQFSKNELAFMEAAAKTCKENGDIIHTRLDYLLNEETAAATARAHTAQESKLLKEVWDAANRLGVGTARVHELVDKWNFQVVIDELESRAAEALIVEANNKRSDALALASQSSDYVG